MFATSSADWDADTVCMLRQLWAEGHGASEIGRRMGISKNAVVGKAHRLDLPARPSPIRRGFDTPPRPRGGQPVHRSPSWCRWRPRFRTWLTGSLGSPALAHSPFPPGTAPAVGRSANRRAHHSASPARRT